METNVTLSANKEKQIVKSAKKSFVIAFLLMISLSGLAQKGGVTPDHSVSLYTPTCGAGPQYSIQPVVSNVNSTSNYRWQYKNGTNWVCIGNGANTIGSNTYNVTGAQYNQTTNPGPIVFTNPNSGLNGLIVRIVIYDGTPLTGCTFPGTVYNGDASSVNLTINVSGTPCGGSTPCNAHITSLYFNKLSDNSHLPITNGSTFTPSQISNLYNMEVSATGTVGSVKFTITGPTSSSNIENTAPYNSPGTGSGPWTGAVGSYSVNVKAYSGAGATGSICHDTTINFTLANDCSCPNNLLTNPSFENSATGWSVSGGTLTFGTSYVMCGTYNGFLNWSSGTAKVWQDVTISAGSIVNFKGYSGTHAPGLACSPKLSLIFLNSSNAVISQADAAVTFNVGSGNQLALYTINATAPAGTVKVRVQGSITCNTLKVDGFCLTATPGCIVNAGTDGSTSVCDNSTTPINLYSIITGEQTGGTWSRLTGTGGTFVAASGTFTPAPGATTSTFRYIVTVTATCKDTAIATISISARKFAGLGCYTSVCDTSMTVNLFANLLGASSGGTWSRLTGSGGTFNPTAGTFISGPGSTNSIFLYVITGTVPCPNDTSVVTVAVLNCPVHLSGNVYYDANQLADNLVNSNAEAGGFQTIPAGVYAILYNPATNTVVATQPITQAGAPNNGTPFTFHVNRNTDYQIMLSTSNPAVGQPIPSPSLPPAPAYFFTGESQAGGGNNAGVVDGRSPVIHVGSIDVVNVNFGIKAPTGGGGE